jgi:hypothetical protein
MPIVYGKTPFSTCKDLKDLIGRYMGTKDINDITSLCFKYWEKEFYGMKNLMTLVASISWVAAAIQLPVKVSTKYWVTHQDYFVKTPVRITLRYKVNNPRPKAKRAVVTLRILTNKRNTRKTASSTFANFIHQKDGLTAIHFIEMMMKIRNNPGLNNLDLNKAPIYTVHDNFITTPLYANYLPYIYRRAVRDMGHPLCIINKLIYDNIIAATPLEGVPPTISEEIEAIQNNYCGNDPKECSPFREEILDYCLTTLSKLRKKSTPEGKGFNTSGWKARKKLVLNSYKTIASALTSPEGQKKWKTLSQSLGRHYDPNGHEYSLHY